MKKFLLFVTTLFAMLGFYSNTNAASFNLDTNIGNPSTDEVEKVMNISTDMINKSNHFVLLVHGANNTADAVWNWGYVRQMKKDGFIPVTINLPHMNTDNLMYSGNFVAQAVWILKRDYPNFKVSIVAHSMGNMATAWSLQRDKTSSYMAQHIDSFVSIGAPFQGTKVKGLNDTLPNLPALLQVLPTSNFVKTINNKPFPAPIRYLSIISKNDELATDSGQTALHLASLPKGTIGVVQTPQDVFNEPNKKISHVQELGDNGIYQMVKSFLNNKPVDKNSGSIDHYSEIDLVSYNKFLSDKKVGDAQKISTEPTDESSF